MSKKYEKLSQFIIKNVGGKENVQSVYHCATRLRFTLVDEKKANKAALEADPGVTAVIINSGSFQVVIGAYVADVFEEIEKLVDVGGGNKTENAPKKKKGLSGAFDFISGVFMPIIPALSGAGMIKALLAILVVAKVVSTDSQTYYLLNNIFSDGVFYFLPMMLAYTTAQKLKCNPILAISVAAMMMHPNWLSLVSAGEPVKFFDVIPFTLVGYASSVIPVILVILVQSYVEKFLKKIIPATVELVLLPLLTFLTMGTLAFSIIGPLGNIIGQYLANFFMWLSESAAWAPPLLIGLTCPLMVMIGLHNAIAPLGVMQMANLGFDGIWGPGNICSNMALAAATGVVAFRAKSKQTKQLAATSSVTAFLGITEPALYGINLPMKYPLIASLIGGGCGGLFAGLTHTHRFATGSPSIFATTLYIGDNTMKYFYNIVIAIIIAVVISSVLTFIFSVIFDKKQASAMENDAQEAKTITTKVKDATMASPAKGKVLPLSECKDASFASEAMGKGVVIEPEEGKIVAPFNAKVVSLFPTNHAIGLESDDGIELLIHIGIDTVDLKGKHFKALIKQDDYVKAGQELIEFDVAAIEKEGYSAQTMLIVTNTADYSKITAIGGNTTTYNQNLLSLRA